MNPDEIRKILKEELQPLIKTQAEFGKTQGEMLKTQTEFGKTQGEMLKTQGEMLKTQGEMLKTQDEFGKTQKNILETLTEHGEKLDALTEEMHHVHQLADVTVDVVTARYEKNKGEIDEIKDHLHLPKKPYFGNVD